jgi:hypothetical protein
MWRRCLLAVAVTWLTSMAGCGLIQTGLTTLEADVPGSAWATFDAPVNLVFAAASEAAEPDFLFKSFYFSSLSVTSAQGIKALNDAVVPGKRTFKAGVPIEEVNLGSGRIVGKTKDGRPATLWLMKREFGKKTEVSLRIGNPYDPGLSSDFDLIAAYLDRIEDKQAHPTRRSKGETAAKASAENAVDQGGTDR